jgi:hypothetical protein
MKWTGFTLASTTRKARIQRSHGCWLALVFDRRGQVSSGEYFSYGVPGSLALAKTWCEQRLSPRRAASPEAPTKENA